MTDLDIRHAKDHEHEGEDERSPHARPDAQPIVLLQAERLSALTGVPVKRLVGRTIRELRGELEFDIDLTHLLFRRVCGQVVKHNQATGLDEPVPYATVYIEDTDLTLFGYFPEGSKWWWPFPLRSRREVIATCRTDDCGNFCCWIPRFDIDYIKTWRVERHCYPIIFRKPTIADLLDDIEGAIPERLPVGPPEPDPAPFELTAHADHGARRDLPVQLSVSATIADRPAKPLPDGVHLDAAHIGSLDAVLGTNISSDLLPLLANRRFGGPAREPVDVMDRPAFPDRVNPPMSETLAALLDRKRHPELAEKYGIDPKLLERFRPERHLGPLVRCWWELVPEVTTIVDVPDITFRVTQDVNADGVEETIYSESFFDVRWDSGPIPDVTLYADPIAFSAPFCRPPVGPHSCATAQIIQAGEMPVINPPSPPGFPYLDPTSGYVAATGRGPLVGPPKCHRRRWPRRRRCGRCST